MSAARPISMLFLILCIGASSQVIRAENGHGDLNLGGPESNESEWQQVISYDEAKVLFADLSANRRFRMFEAGAHCYHRSQLIGRYLEQRKISSHQLYIDCYGELIGVVAPETGFYAQYGDHWTNVLWVKREGSAKAKPYVFDPQFTDSPVLLEDYLKTIVSPGIRMERSEKLTNPKKPCGCFYRLVDRRSYQAVRNGIFEKREAQQEALGLIDSYGRDISIEPRKRRKLEFQLDPLAQWYDPRIKWDENDLLRLAKGIDGWNEVMSQSNGFQRGLAKFTKEKPDIREIARDRRSRAVEAMLAETQRRRAQLEAYYAFDKAVNNTKALEGSKVHFKELAEEQACFERELRSLEKPKK